MSEVRIMPMPVPHPVWRRNCGGYPDIMQISFRNGHVRSYIDQVIQPRPHTIRTDELNRLFRENPLGYQPKHLKK